MKDGGRGTAGVPAARLRTALVIAQVAISLFLLVGAGLLLRSFSSILRVSPGFDPEGAIAAEINPAGPAYQNPEARERYFERALRTAAEVPGVTAAGANMLLPTRGKYGQTYSIEGFEMRAGERFLLQSAAGGGYGDPARRDAAAAARDAAEGYVSCRD